jgi:hypothetical protein
MKRGIAIFSLALASWAAGSSAQAEIVKCVDASGRVTLTDLPCSSGAVVPISTGSATVPAGTDPVITAEEGYHEPPPPPDPLRMGATRVHLSRAEFGPAGSSRTRYAHMSRPTPSQSMAIDAATLRAARSSLQMGTIGATIASR